MCRPPHFARDVELLGKDVKPPGKWEVMNQQGDDKELMAAFAEFKELLRRDAEPPGASNAPEVRLEPEIGAESAGAEPVSHAPSLDFPEFDRENVELAGFDIAESEPPEPASRVAARPRAASRPAAAPADYAGWTPAASAEDALFASDVAKEGGRRKLIYLSLAIVVAGLVGVGWTLSNWQPPTEEEPEIADVAPSAETEAAASEQAAEPAAAAREEAVRDEAAKDETAAVGPHDPPSQKPAPATSAAAAVPVEPAPAAVPLTDAPVIPAAPSRAAPAKSPVAAVAPVAPPGGAVAPLPATGAGAVARLTPPTPAKATPQPEKEAVAPARAPVPPAAEAAPAEPRPAAPAKVAKPKAKPAQTAAKPAKPKAALPPAAAPESAALVEPAAPPPPPPPQSDGAFGFVKRTVNSVGSAIGGIGRSVVP